jgi:DNA repair protein SbcC/Rad50
MIPVLLHLKNFLSYGDDVPPLDFTEFDVACLSGANGHGKSAILDAMTWALWGEARKAIGEKSPADGLLRIGATEMRVEFVFDLEADRYRVIRKYQRKKGKRGTPSLEFQIWDSTAGAYRPLSEKSITQTQDKINATLRMRYDTFINSAFILQGHVDEFTKRNPSQRKAVLADILDLSRYETLRDMAREHLRAAEREEAALKQKLSSMADEIQHKTAYELTLNDLRLKLDVTDTHLQTAETDYQTLLRQQAELHGQQQRLTEKQQQRQRVNQDVEQLKQRIRRQEEQIAENAAMLDREPAILAEYQRYHDAHTRNAVCEDQRRQHADYQAECAPLERAIMAARHALETEREKWQAERAQVQRAITEAQQFLAQAQDIEHGYRDLCAGRQQDEQWEAQRLQADELSAAIRKVEADITAEQHRLDVEVQSLQRQIGDAQTLAEQQPEHERQLARLLAEAERLRALEQEFARNTDDGAQCRAALDALKARREHTLSAEQEIRERADLLRRSQQPQCPLCQAALDDQKKRDITAHFQQQLASLASERDQLEHDIAEHEARLTQLRKAYKQLEQQLRQHQAVRQRVAQAEHAVHTSQQAADRIQALQTNAEALTAALRQQDYAHEAHRQLAALRQQHAALQYDASAHQALRKRLKTWQHFDGAYSKLEDTRCRHDRAAARLPELDDGLAALHARLEQRDYARAEQDALQAMLSRIQALGYDAEAHRRLQQELQQLQRAPQRKAELDQARKAASALERAYAELLEERQHKTEQLAEVQRALTTLETQLQRLGPVEQQVLAQEQALRQLRAERDDLLQRQGTYQSKHDHCLNLERQYAVEQQRKTAIDKDCQMYGALIDVFGKDGGIQTYLIENAIPEIEDEANAILSRLTDNRTAIAIESVKDSQSGGLRETLDIKISDELGTRSYELYSGGEAFRVDFSIRVALSRLLATRAGTRLKTLVIDEGFGTQDARGLEQLVQAITEISKDFEKILVITHIEALKDAFPVRIEVVKLPDIGSQYQVIH